MRLDDSFEYHLDVLPPEGDEEGGKRKNGFEEPPPQKLLVDVYGENATPEEEKKAEEEPTIDLSKRDGLVVELHQLPFLTSEGEQTPIGARGWYSSAVLSTLLMSGHPLITNDLMKGIVNKSTATNTIIELGSGTIGLCGFTAAWVMSQLLNRSRNNQEVDEALCSTPLQSKCRVVMTDYDEECLDQLRMNTICVKQRLLEYYNTKNMNHLDGQVDIDVQKLDWNDHDKHQDLLDGECQSHNGDEEVSHRLSSVSFVCGAALVYCEDTVACSDQVIKILKMYPNAAVWVVQWPRKGWFSVFQQQCSKGDVGPMRKVRVEKFHPTKLVEDIHERAFKLMPPQIELDVHDIRVVRISTVDTAENDS